MAGDLSAAPHKELQALCNMGLKVLDGDAQSDKFGPLALLKDAISYTATSIRLAAKDNDDGGKAISDILLSTLNDKGPAIWPLSGPSEKTPWLYMANELMATGDLARPLVFENDKDASEIVKACIQLCDARAGYDRPNVTDRDLDQNRAPVESQCDYSLSQGSTNHALAAGTNAPKTRSGREEASAARAAARLIPPSCLAICHNIDADVTLPPNVWRGDEENPDRSVDGHFSLNEIVQTYQRLLYGRKIEQKDVKKEMDIWLPTLKNRDRNRNERYRDVVCTGCDHFVSVVADGSKPFTLDYMQLGPDSLGRGVWACRFNSTAGPIITFLSHRQKGVENANWDSYVFWTLSKKSSEMSGFSGDHLLSRPVPLWKDEDFLNSRADSDGRWPVCECASCHVFIREELAWYCLGQKCVGWGIHYCERCNADVIAMEQKGCASHKRMVRQQSQPETERDAQPKHSVDQSHLQASSNRQDNNQSRFAQEADGAMASKSATLENVDAKSLQEHEHRTDSHGTKRQASEHDIRSSHDRYKRLTDQGSLSERPETTSTPNTGRTWIATLRFWPQDPERDYGPDLIASFEKGTMSLGWEPFRAYQEFKQKHQSPIRALRFQQSFVDSGREFNGTERYNMTAALIHMYGKTLEGDERCKACIAGFSSPFGDCVVATGWAHNACSNHVFNKAHFRQDQHGNHRCSLYQNDIAGSVPPLTKNTGLASSAPVTPLKLSPMLPTTKFPFARSILDPVSLTPSTTSDIDDDGGGTNPSPVESQSLTVIPTDAKKDYAAHILTTFQTNKHRFNGTAAVDKYYEFFKKFKNTPRNALLFKQSWVDGNRAFNLRKYPNMIAALVHIFGNVVESGRQCEARTGREHGPFQGCVVDEGTAGGSCSNHIYGKANNRHCGRHSMREGTATTAVTEAGPSALSTGDEDQAYKPAGWESDELQKETPINGRTLRELRKLSYVETSEQLTPEPGQGVPGSSAFTTQSGDQESVQRNHRIHAADAPHSPATPTSASEKRHAQTPDLASTLESTPASAFLDLVRLRLQVVGQPKIEVMTLSTCGSLDAFFAKIAILGGFKSVIGSPSHIESVSIRPRDKTPAGQRFEYTVTAGNDLIYEELILDLEEQVEGAYDRPIRLIADIQLM